MQTLLEVYKDYKDEMLAPAQILQQLVDWTDFRKLIELPEEPVNLHLNLVNTILEHAIHEPLGKANALY